MIHVSYFSGLVGFVHLRIHAAAFLFNVRGSAISGISVIIFSVTGFILLPHFKKIFPSANIVRVILWPFVDFGNQSHLSVRSGLAFL